MPTQQALNSLRLLAGGPSAQQRRPTDFRFSGAIPTQGELESPFEMEQAQQAAAADARDRAAVEAVQDENAAITSYNRPEVLQMRRAEDERKLAPIRLRGQFDVETARQNQGNQALMNMLRLQSAGEIAGAKEAGLDKRAGATGGRLERQAQLNNLYRMLPKAAGPGMLSFFGAGGPSEKEKIQAQIDALESQQMSDMGDGGEAVAPVATAPVAAPMPAAGESTAQRLARLRGQR